MPVTAPITALQDHEQFWSPNDKPWTDGLSIAEAQTPGEAGCGDALLTDVVAPLDVEETPHGATSSTSYSTPAGPEPTW